MPEADRIRFAIREFGQVNRTQRCELEGEWIDVGLVGEVLAREDRPGIQLDEQPIDVAEVLHLLDDDTQERSRIRRRRADEIRIGGPECKRTVEVLDQKVLFDLGGFLQKPYEFEIGVGEIPLYRGKPVSRGESPAWTHGDSKHEEISKQRAARDAVALHRRWFRNRKHSMPPAVRPGAWFDRHGFSLTGSPGEWLRHPGRARRRLGRP